VAAYQGFAFSNGIMVLVVDAVAITFLGFYFDQVVPNQFGVASRPWNFICKCKSKKPAEARW